MGVQRQRLPWFQQKNDKEGKLLILDENALELLYKLILVISQRCIIEEDGAACFYTNLNLEQR